MATLFTGLYSHQNKITGNNPANTPENAAHAKRTGKDPKELIISNIDKHGGLPHWLGKEGYVSHQSGKWWEGSYQRGGFTEGMTRGFPKPGGRHGDDGLKIGRAGMEPVLDFIDRSIKKEKPFLHLVRSFPSPYSAQSARAPAQEVLGQGSAEKGRSVLRYVRMV